MYAVLALVVCFVVATVAASWWRRRSRVQQPRAAAPPAPIARTKDSAPPPDRYAPSVLLLVGEEHAVQLETAIAMRTTRVASSDDLVAEALRSFAPVLIVDVDLLPQLEGRLPDVPIIGVFDGEPASALGSIVRVLERAHTLSSVLVASTFGTPEGRRHLTHVLKRLTSDSSHDMLGASSTGRVAKIAKASHRGARFDRMCDYFTQHGVSQRTVTALQDVAEELVMNALYNAPTEAGYFAKAVSRTEDVTLPADRACVISYGMDGGDVFVRVRDHFGSLERSRLLDVLTRCTAKEVTLDESRGGAGLGMWRIFSGASAISVEVNPDRLTDIVVRLPAKGRTGRQLMGIHLFFAPRRDDDAFMLDRQSSLVDHSITFVQV